MTRRKRGSQQGRDCGLATGGTNWLTHIGPHVWPSPVQNALLTALETGEPLLVGGDHGCAKTVVTSSSARALGLSFIALDASKSNWEDLIGFINPAGLTQGRVEYVPSPLSLWDKEFILIDEISRAKPRPGRLGGRPLLTHLPDLPGGTRTRQWKRPSGPALRRGAAVHHFLPREGTCRQGETISLARPCWTIMKETPGFTVNGR